jgi:hypothetical protein
MDAADEARAWLRSQGLSDAEIEQVEGVMRSSGHPFDAPTLQRLDIGELRAAVAAPSSPSRSATPPRLGSGRATPPRQRAPQGEDTRAWLRRQRFSAAQIDTLETMMQRAGHTFDIPTLQQLDMSELREAVGAGASGDDPADEARQWLLDQDLNHGQVERIEVALRGSGHNLDTQTLQRLGITELRAAVGSESDGGQPARSPRSRAVSATNLERITSRDIRDEDEDDEAAAVPSMKLLNLAEPKHPYNAMRRLRLALLVALRGKGDLARYEPGRASRNDPPSFSFNSWNFSERSLLRITDVFENCAEGLADMMLEVKDLSREDAEEMLDGVENRISDSSGMRRSSKGCTGDGGSGAQHILPTTAILLS